MKQHKPSATAREAAAWTPACARSFVLLSAASVIFASACGPSKPEKDEKLEVAAAAMLSGNRHELNPVSKEEAQAVEKILAEKKAKEAQSESARQQAIEALAVLPNPMPKNIKAACDEMLEAYHGFQLRARANDGRALMNWWDNKRIELGKLRQTCTALASVEAAACQKAAFSEADGTLGGQETAITTACVNKFAASNRDEVRRRKDQAESQAR